MWKIVKKVLTNTGPKILTNLKSKNYLYNEPISNLDFRNFGNLNKDKVFYIIRRNPSAGFFSNITFILNHLKICERMKFIPVVDMLNYPNLYNETHKIKKNSTK